MGGVTGGVGPKWEREVFSSTLACPALTDLASFRDGKPREESLLVLRFAIFEKNGPFSN